MRCRSMISGVAGWLLVLIFAMMVMWPLMSLAALLSSLQGIELACAGSRHAIWVQSRMVMWMIFIVSTSLSVWAGWRLYIIYSSESVNFAVSAMWIAWPLMSFFMVAAAVSILKDPRAAAVYTPALYNLIFSIICAIAGTAYLYRSIRVQNTYRMPVYL